MPHPDPLERYPHLWRHFVLLTEIPINSLNTKLALSLPNLNALHFAYIQHVAESL